MKITTCCATVAQQLRNPLTWLADIRDPKSARIAIGWGTRRGLSLSQMGVLLGESHPNGHHGRPVHRSTVCYIEQGRSTTPEMVEAYGLAVARIITARTSGRVMVSFDLSGRRWKFKASAPCAKCGRAFAVTDLREKNCPKCRRSA